MLPGLSITSRKLKTLKFRTRWDFCFISTYYFFILVTRESISGDKEKERRLSLLPKGCSQEFQDVIKVKKQKQKENIYLNIAYAPVAN